MKAIVIGAHLLRDDVEPIAEPLPVGSLFLSTHSVADDQPLGDRELLLRVADMRARLLDVASFVAIRYGFTARDAADAETRCGPHLARWRELLETHRTDVEITLKVAAASPQPRPSREQFARGADYLRALHDARQAAAPDPAFRRDVEASISPLALRSRWIHRDERSLELVALVPRERLPDLQRVGEEIRRRNPSVPFLLSGPWPLEVFADADHE